MEVLLQDLRFTLRTLVKRWGFTVAVILTLGLGIGADIAIFNVVDSLLIHSLPYPQSENLIDMGYWPKGAFLNLRQQIDTATIASFVPDFGGNLTGHGEPVRLEGAQISPELFRVFGVQPFIGRSFMPDEELPGKDRKVILSYSLWQQLFRGDPSIVGHSITLEGVDREILGVMPRSFQFPSNQTQLWIPIEFDLTNPRGLWGTLGHVIGRLKPGARITDARANLKAAVPVLRSTFPWKMPESWGSWANATSLQEAIVGNIKPRILLLFSAVSFVLLIACANVANMLLSRGLGRQKEIAARLALGATRLRIVRQLLTESLILAVSGTSIGVLIAMRGIPIAVFSSTEASQLPEVKMGGSVLLFAISITLLTTVLFGLLPAIRGSSVGIHDILKSGEERIGMSRERRRLSSILVISEVALSVVLLIAAALLAKSMQSIEQIAPGFTADRVLTARVTPDQSYCSNPSKCYQFYSEIMDRLRSLPGVESAAVVDVLPLSGRSNSLALEIEGHPNPNGNSAPAAWPYLVAPDYLRAMDIKVLRGRSFTDSDRAGGMPVVLVDASFADRFWPGENPIGKHVRPVWQQAWRTVVGVVQDVRHFSLTDNPAWEIGEIYIPYDQGLQSIPPPAMTVVVRSNPQVQLRDSDIRATVALIDSKVPINEIRTMREILGESIAGSRSTMHLTLDFAALALILTAIGIYAVISYMVGWRTHEIRLRVAVGAQQRDILRLILRQGMILILYGLIIGLAIAFAVGRLMANLLYHVRSTDPFIIIMASVVIVFIGLIASYFPATKATKLSAFGSFGD